MRLTHISELHAPHPSSSVALGLNDASIAVLDAPPDPTHQKQLGIALGSVENVDSVILRSVHKIGVSKASAGSVKGKFRKLKSP